MFYRASTARMPSSTDIIIRSLTRLTRSVRKVLSSVMICDTFATESLGSAVSSFVTGTLPGASTSRGFAVNTAAITVWIRLRLKSSDSDATGSGSSVQQTSPRRTTRYLSAATAPASRQ